MAKAIRLVATTIVTMAIFSGAAYADCLAASGQQLLEKLHENSDYEGNWSHKKTRVPVAFA